MPLVYDELRRLAQFKMASEAPQTLSATSLVHEAYLRLLGGEETRPLVWENRRQFLGAAAEAMRRILIDRARARSRIKRGGGLSREEQAITQIATPMEEEEIVEISDALELFSQHDPDCAEMVKLKYFVGLSWEEIAELTGNSTRTVRRRWAYARAWLFDAVEKGRTQ